MKLVTMQTQRDKQSEIFHISMQNIPDIHWEKEVHAQEQAPGNTARPPISSFLFPSQPNPTQSYQLCLLIKDIEWPGHIPIANDSDKCVRFKA